VEDPDFFTFYENWGSGEKLGAHLAAPHVVDFAAKMGDLLDDAGQSINRVRRIAGDLCSRPPDANRAPLPCLYLPLGSGDLRPCSGSAAATASWHRCGQFACHAPLFI
jgi:hypothetical protein